MEPDSYHCPEKSCLTPVYQPCQEHEGDPDRRSITVLACGHYFHTCCLPSGELCSVCVAPLRAIRRFTVTNRTSQKGFEKHFYRLLRDRLVVDLPLTCWDCRVDLSKGCPRHQESVDRERLVFLTCGHGFHVCCLDRGTTCPVCLAPVRVFKTVRLQRDATPQQVRGYYQRHYGLAPDEIERVFGLSRDRQRDSYFKDRLDDSHAKYCRCLLHVSAQQPDWCLEEEAWWDARDGSSCYNPYAVCTKSVRRTGRLECFLNYDLNQIPKREIAKLVVLKGKLLDKHGLSRDLRGLRLLQHLQKK
jgi:hypothetical protein